MSSDLAPMTRHDHPKRPELKNFQRVNARLFRGGMPRGTGMARLKEMGVRTIMDLRGRGRKTLVEEEQARALGIRYYRIPLGHLRGPTAAAIDRVLQILDEPQNWPVYVHCRRGCDRTGTVVACYRIASESWTAEKAIAEALDLGMQATEFLKRAFIRRFHRARQAARALDRTRVGDTR
jgi:tyrosine-protein phosphatase SIW14